MPNHILKIIFFHLFICFYKVHFVRHYVIVIENSGRVEYNTPVNCSVKKARKTILYEVTVVGHPMKIELTHCRIDRREKFILVYVYVQYCPINKYTSKIFYKG